MIDVSIPHVFFFFDIRGVYAAATTIYLAEHVSSVPGIHCVQLLVHNITCMGAIRSNSTDRFVAMESTIVV